MVVPVTKEWHGQATPLQVLKRQMMKATDIHEMSDCRCGTHLSFWIDHAEDDIYFCTNLYTGCHRTYALNMKPDEPIRLPGESINFMSSFEELSYLICPVCK
jgi:hypothetical protein